MYECLVRAKTRVSSCDLLWLWLWFSCGFGCGFVVAGLKTALICPFVQALFQFPILPNGQHAAPVLPEITIGHF